MSSPQKSKNTAKPKRRLTQALAAIIAAIIVALGYIIAAIVNHLPPFQQPVPPPLVQPSSTSTLPTKISPSSPSEMLAAYEAIQPIYQDQLNYQSNPRTQREGWPAGPAPKFGAACTFTPTGYVVSVSNGDLNTPNPSWCKAKQAYRDTLIEVTVKITSGRAGLLFRDQHYNEKSGYYSFEIDPSKDLFKVFINANGTYQPLGGLDWRKFPAGVQRGDTHLLQVIAQGSRFYFYIDRVPVAEATDTTYMEGNVGFVCYNPHGGTKGEALFSNLSIRNLPKT